MANSDGYRWEMRCVFLFFPRQLRTITYVPPHHILSHRDGYFLFTNKENGSQKCYFLIQSEAAQLGPRPGSAGSQHIVLSSTKPGKDKSVFSTLKKLVTLDTLLSPFPTSSLF